MPKFRRGSSEEVSTQSPFSVSVRESGLYSDSADVGARVGVGVPLNSKPLFACRSLGSGDAAATSMRVTDDSAFVGGIC